MSAEFERFKKNFGRLVRSRANVGVLFFTAMSGFILLLGYTNCVQSRTDHGQSNNNSGIQVVSIGNPMQPSNQLLDQICSTITRCHSEVTSQQCHAALLATSGFAGKLGLSNVSYSSYSDIVLAEGAGTVISDPQKLLSCSTGVSNLSCTSQAAINAYSPSSTNPFSAAPDLLSSSSAVCASSFNENSSGSTSTNPVTTTLSSTTTSYSPTSTNPTTTTTQATTTTDTSSFEPTTTQVSLCHYGYEICASCSDADLQTCWNRWCRNQPPGTCTPYP